MKVTKAMRRLRAPGLPARPFLYFDDAKRHAVVVSRHDTWRSHELSMICTEVLVWAAIAALGWFWWPWIPHFEMVLRIILFLIAWAFTGNIVLRLVRLSLRDFLARRLFATKVVVGFSPEAIMIQSHCYERPLIVWRTWRKLPVRVRFMLGTDDEANTYKASLSPNRKFPKQQIQEAGMLMLLIEVAHQGQGVMMRNIPLVSMNQKRIPDFTVVYDTAAKLTEPKQAGAKRQRARGLDIDLR